MSSFPVKFLLPGFLVLLAAGCGPETAEKHSLSADTIALAGKIPIYQKDLDHALSLAGNRPAKEVLEELATEEAMAQLALAEGVAEAPPVRAAIRRLLASRMREKHSQAVIIDQAAIEGAIASGEATAPALRQQYHLAFLRQRFSTAGTEAAAVAALEKARNDFAAMPPDPTRRGFGTLAAEVSDDIDTRYQGGDAGWVIAGKSHVLLPDSVTSALTALKQPGLLPDIIRSADAAWLAMLIDIKTPSVPKIVPAQIEARLRAEKESEQAAALMARARAAHPLTILHPQNHAGPATPPSLPPTPPG